MPLIVMNKYISAVVIMEGYLQQLLKSAQQEYIYSLNYNCSVSFSCILSLFWCCQPYYQSSHFTQKMFDFSKSATLFQYVCKHFRFQSLSISIKRQRAFIFDACSYEFPLGDSWQKLPSSHWSATSHQLTEKQMRMNNSDMIKDMLLHTTTYSAATHTTLPPPHYYIYQHSNILCGCVGVFCSLRVVWYCRGSLG